MNDQPPSRALSFAGVADAYDRARPSYPREAAEWLTGSTPHSVLELGAGTGKLTDQLLAIGHDVLATDPLDEMLQFLRLRHPACRTAVASAESIPVAPRTVDVVVSAQAFHWFDVDAALPEIARVLKPEGTLALVWNSRDDRIPWVRRLGRLIDTPEQERDPANALIASRLFGYVEERTFRFWQPLRKPELRDLVLSRSNIAIKTATERQHVLRQVDALYDEYDRGPDGLLMPYVTQCFKAVVRPVVLEESGPIHLNGAVPRPGATSPEPKVRVTPAPDEDDGTPLFSLR
ncbi:MAG TPA: class I SAM-dependent methyltransferase [Nocardioidaceae bacterium]|nr:class I SAM-dependent methyltransferase [Nocardioidaceae bacterium]